MYNTLLAHKFLCHGLKRIGYAHDAAITATWWLLEELTKISRAHLAIQPLDLTSRQIAQLTIWLDEIAQHKPLAYIVGQVPFCGLPIRVKPPVLIPRPETEQWVIELVGLIKSVELDRPLKILDIGTGSGCVALSLAAHLGQAQVTAVDCAEPALELARENQLYLGIKNAHFVYSNLFEKLQNEQFDLIVSNPPYICAAEYAQLSPDVTKWEDKQALCSGEGGLDLIRQLIEQAPQYLRTICKNVPQLVVEIDRHQATKVCALLIHCGYTGVSVKKDLSGSDRVVYAQVLSCGPLDERLNSSRL